METSAVYSSLLSGCILLVTCIACHVLGTIQLNLCSSGWSVFGVLSRESSLDDYCKLIKGQTSQAYRCRTCQNVK
jgi:hypothetical protein